MTLLEIAIRAAQAADPHFVLARRPKIAEEALGFALSQSGAPANALFIFAQGRIAPASTVASWVALKPEQRSAWEIFRATASILYRVEGEERAKAERAKPRARMAVPDWMLDGEDDFEAGMGDRLAIGMPRPAPRKISTPPAPETPRLPERTKTKARRTH